jgi:bidirectional [NiFe] hydrogenase diaphorase subunit
MSKVKLEIDGKTITAEAGTTLLQAAREAAIDIPTLCHNDRLKPAGDCRLCMVEVVKGKRTRLVASCCYPIEDGLQVTTSTPRIEKHRKLILELLWPTAGHLAKRYGVTSSRFDSEMTDCNLCGLCVRYCQEVAKKNVLYFKGRGTARRVAFVPGLADQCGRCKQCFGLCTGGFVDATWARMDYGA